MEQVTVCSSSQKRQGTVSRTWSPNRATSTADWPQGQGSRLPAAANWNTVRSTITGLRHTGQRKAMERLASSIMGTTSVEF